MSIFTTPGSCVNLLLQAVSEMTRVRRAGSLVVAWVVCTTAAQAALSLFPTRVELEGNQRAAQVELMNTGTQPETYRISLVNRRMGEKGEFISITEPGPGERFADGMLRYSPRQVTVSPGSSQTVRVLLRKPVDLAEGEYRSHLQFDRVEDVSGATSIESLASDNKEQIGVVIKALVGASIPVIVRHGKTEASVTLSDLVLVPAADGQPPAVALSMNRSGSRSVYGDLSITYTPRQGAPVEVSRAGGVAVYVPNPLRKARMPLTLPAGVELAGGTLVVTFRQRAEAGGRVMAESRLVLP